MQRLTNYAMLTEKITQLFDNSRIKNYATTKSKEVYAKVITNGGSSFIISVPLIMRYLNFGAVIFLHTIL